MTTVKSKLDKGAQWRLEIADFICQLVEDVKNYKLVLEPPPGIKHWRKNRVKMAKEEHGKLTRETGDLGLCFMGTLYYYMNVIAHGLMELIPQHSKNIKQVQVKAWDKLPADAIDRVLELIGRRLYLINVSLSKDFKHPDKIYVCSGKRVTANLLTIHKNKGDSNKVMVDFSKIAPYPPILTKAKGLRSGEQALAGYKMLVDQIKREMHYKGDNHVNGVRHNGILGKPQRAPLDKREKCHDRVG